MKKFECTLALYKAGNIFVWSERGVKPLLDALDGGEDFCAAVAVDKVVGRAAAFLYQKLGVSEVFAEVASIGALELLKKAGIKISARTTVQKIINRKRRGPCPMEEAVATIGDSDIDGAIKAIKARAKELFATSASSYTKTSGKV